MPSKSSMLQRQLKLNTFYIYEMEQWLEDVRGDYQSVCKVRKRIKQLAELQVFLKQQLQQAYVAEKIEQMFDSEIARQAEVIVRDDYKHSPLFMAEAPPAELGSFVVDECDAPPDGWYCTRGAGHNGPCAAYPSEEQT